MSDLVEKARAFRQRVLDAGRVAEEAKSLAAEARQIADRPRPNQ